MPKKNKTPLEKVLYYLSYRSRTEKEIRDQFGAEITEELILYLKETKLIDDGEFAKLYTASRLRQAPRSRKLIELELKRKGIVSDLTHLNDLDSAKSALEKKKTLKSRDQAIRFLQSRGFSWGIIEQVIKNKYNSPDVR